MKSLVVYLLSSQFEPQVFFWSLYQLITFTETCCPKNSLFPVHNTYDNVVQNLLSRLKNNVLSTDTRVFTQPGVS